MFHYPPTNSHKEKQKIGRQNDNCIYEIKLSNPSQFAGQLITICQAVHLIMSQLSQKQMFPKPTNATIIISTLTSSNYFMQCSSLKISTYCPVRKNQHLSLAKCKLHCILKNKTKICVILQFMEAKRTNSQPESPPITDPGSHSQARSLDNKVQCLLSVCHRG